MSKVTNVDFLEDYDEEDYGNEYVDLGDLQEDLKLMPGDFTTAKLKQNQNKGQDKYASKNAEFEEDVELIED